MDTKTTRETLTCIAESRWDKRKKAWVPYRTWDETKKVWIYH